MFPWNIFLKGTGLFLFFAASDAERPVAATYPNTATTTIATINASDFSSPVQAPTWKWYSILYNIIIDFPSQSYDIDATPRESGRLDTITTFITIMRKSRSLSYFELSRVGGGRDLTDCYLFSET